jgi:hypothetical protein
LEARIADFGLARMMIQKNETVTMVAGSYGYIAPGWYLLFIFYIMQLTALVSLKYK